MLKSVAIDYTPAYEQGGGIGRYVRELTSALAVQDASTDYRLFVAGAVKQSLPPPPAQNFEWKPTRITPSWFARIWHRAHLPIPVEAIVGQVDLFHATDFALPPTLPTTKTLLTVHDLSFVHVPETASSTLKAYLDHVVPNSAYRADHVLADSQATKDDLVQLYGLPSDKVTVLYSGVSPVFLEVTVEEQQRIRDKYGLGQKPYVLSVGTIQPRKNYSRVIKVLARLRAEGYDLQYVISGGKGWLEDDMYRMIEATGMESHVRLLGFVDDGDLPALYSGAFCLVFSSLYEGFGLPILEAMACNTPVVTSNVSSMLEVAGDAALLVNPYDVNAITMAIQSLLDDPDLRATLIAKGQKQIKRFTWEATARQLLDIYENLLSTN